MTKTVGTANREIHRVYLAGTPNCGKTTLFNTLTGMKQTVGNRPGVTVSGVSAFISGKYTDMKIELTDLPGVYSFDPVSPDEAVASEAVRNGSPELVIYVCDKTELERTLYPAVQLSELGVPFVLAMNMSDEAEIMGISTDEKKLGELLGCSAVSVSALKGEGLAALADTVMAELSRTACTRPEKNERGSGRSMTPSERHDFCRRIADECTAYREGNAGVAPGRTEKADKIVMNRFLAFPILFAVIGAVYFLSVGSIGGYLSKIFSAAVNGEGTVSAVTGMMKRLGCTPTVISLVTDGILGGIGTVTGFLPQLAVLYFMMSLLEEIGYMTRAAVITDRIFARFGLSGRSAVPMIVGCGCSVPAVMSCRIMENRHERNVSVITSSFIPCSAKLPVISLAAAEIFGGAVWVALSVYLAGLASVFVTALLFGGKGKRTAFVMELPRYRRPRISSVIRSTAVKVGAFMKKAATVIFLISLAVWFLSYFGFSGGRLNGGVPYDMSILSKVGNIIAPLFRPLGFGFWEAAVATVMGLAAKEELAGVLGILSGSRMSACTGMSAVGLSGLSTGFTRPGAYSFIMFNMLCVPCIATVAAMKQELKGIGSLGAALLYRTVYAYLSAFTVYRIWLAAENRSADCFTLLAVGIAVTVTVICIRRVCRR